MRDETQFAMHSVCVILVIPITAIDSIYKSSQILLCVAETKFYV